MRRFTSADLPATADVLVVGGGITGASVARDAALRGLSTVLVERDDFASGTSSRSSKLIHGGLRYLQTYQFALVHESVREREVMMRIAPHLATLRPFLYLIYEGDPEGKALLNLGLTFYDAFARAPRRRRHRMLGRGAVLRREPYLNPEGLRGGGLFYDALTDDARLVLDVLESATAPARWWPTTAR
jgi:glycerol-3-phosphate dehydrogenase